MTSPWDNPPQLPTGPRVGDRPVFPAAAPLVPVEPAPPFTLADDPALRTAVDPALDGYTPPTLDDLGLTADPVAQVIYLRGLAAEIELGMTEQQRADLAQYEQPTRHLRSVA